MDDYPGNNALVIGRRALAEGATAIAASPTVLLEQMRSAGIGA